MQKDKLKKLKRAGLRRIISFYGIWVLVVVMQLVIAFSTVVFYNSLQKQLFQERQSHLTEMTTKISEVVDLTTDTVQNKTTTAVSYLQKKEFSSSEKLMGTLKRVANVLELGDSVLLALDDDAKYYGSDQKSGRWENVSDLVSKKQKTVIRDFTVDGEKVPCMVFIAPFSKKVVLGDDGHRLSHVAILMPVESMKEYLSISMFGQDCYTYMINHHGRRLYKQTFSAKFIEEFNVLSALKDDTFLMGGDLNSLYKAVENEKQFCAEYKDADSGKNYFVSTVPVKNSEWTVLLFVPTKILGVQTGQFMNSVVRYFICIALEVLVIGFVLIFTVLRNASDHKLLNQQKEYNRLLEAEMEKANSANAAKSEFLSHMSHDIRTPINGIVGMSHIALKNVTDRSRVEDCIHKIQGAADHLLTLINDVLDMSKIESGKVVMSSNPMNIQELLDNCVSIIDGQLLSRNLRFYADFGEIAHPYVYGDELHMRQVLINILGNAVKFTPDGGMIYFRATEVLSTEHQVHFRFEVEDTGIGISEEFQSKIFEEFAQENDQIRTNYQGTGLGMAISKNFVEMMGGKISVRSKLGEGTCFRVDMKYEINKAGQVVDEPREPMSLKGVKVLLVEDNELNMEIAEEILEDEGVIVTKAVDGQEAVDKFVKSSRGTFDIILMDIMMPVMNGLDAAKTIRSSAHAEAGTIPIVAMTANAYKEDVQAALDAGMNAHIAKPINIDVFLSVVEKYTRYNNGWKR